MYEKLAHNGQGAVRQERDDEDYRLRRRGSRMFPATSHNHGSGRGRS